MAYYPFPSMRLFGDRSARQIRGFISEPAAVHILLLLDIISTLGEPTLIPEIVSRTGVGPQMRNAAVFLGPTADTPRPPGLPLTMSLFVDISGSRRIGTRRISLHVELSRVPTP